jgi:hypothetical protein
MSPVSLPIDCSGLPPSVARVAESLAASTGARAVALAGSRASTHGDASSDWDLTVYYRHSLDLAPLAAFGDVHAPGSWGRLMNGGAWLSVDGLAVDVMFRDLAVVEHWTAVAQKGSYELDAILGYLAGLPTYVLTAELASGRTLAGELPAITEMPQALVAAAPLRWRFARDFSLEYARMHAARGNAVGATGQAAKAVLEEAHARLCTRGQWVLNEKRMVGAAGLEAAHALFTSPPQSASALAPWLDAVQQCLTE